MFSDKKTVFYKNDKEKMEILILISHRISNIHHIMVLKIMTKINDLGNHQNLNERVALIMI